MSILSVNEVASTQRSASIDDTFTAAFERVFQIVTDGTDGALAVLTASGLPDLFSGYQFPATSPTETDGLSICTSKRAEQQPDSKRNWLVYCEYSSNYNFLGDDAGNPLSVPAVMSFGSVAHEIEAREDKTGLSVCNSAGDPFDPLPQFDRARASIKIKKNLSGGTLGPVLVVGVTNTVNSVSYLGIDAGKLKCQAVNATEQEEQGVSYMAAEFEFLYDEDGWNPVEILDAGYRERRSGATTSTVIVDGDKNPINSPWPLNPSGVKFSDPTVTPNYKEFTMYGTSDFNGLGIV